MQPKCGIIIFQTQVNFNLSYMSIMQNVWHFQKIFTHVYCSFSAVQPSLQKISQHAALLLMIDKWFCRWRTLFLH